MFSRPGVLVKGASNLSVIFLKKRVCLNINFKLIYIYEYQTEEKHCVLVVCACESEVKFGYKKVSINN